MIIRATIGASPSMVKQAALSLARVQRIMDQIVEARFISRKMVDWNASMNCAVMVSLPMLVHGSYSQKLALHEDAGLPQMR